MKKYHLISRTVEAAKILSIETFIDGSAYLKLSGGYERAVPFEWVIRQKPVPGGHFVDDGDGVRFYLCAADFEAKYMEAPEVV